MTSPKFDFVSPRHLVFGQGRIDRLPDLAAGFGSSILIVTGQSSFLKTAVWQALDTRFARKGMDIHQAAIPGEPSPEDVDGIAGRFRSGHIDLVIGIGGGSVLDGGKAVAAMLRQEGAVTDYLEGVGTRRPGGDTLPFIAVPTTSGTGSEATKNAVISRPGPGGFKKSLRHDNFIPDIALVDPSLTLTCPPDLTAACGMDALTQLMEAYVSVKASPVTDALCLSGLDGFGRALETCIETDPLDPAARATLSYGAYISGLALANAGLGTVHGFASVIGGLCTMPHGQVCGTLLAETTKATIESLEAGHPARNKYARVSKILEFSTESASVSVACSRLIDGLNHWTERFGIPGLSQFGITEDQAGAIARTAGRKNSPAGLSRRQMEDILRARC